jgi:hypothetical protein
LSAVVSAHKSMQDVLLKADGFGPTLCKSGDACLYFRGRPSAPDSSFKGVLEIFVIVACQSLSPYRSILSILRAPDRAVIENTSVHETCQGTDDIQLPKELHVLTAEKWEFCISTTLAVNLLDLAADKGVDEWDITVLNYVHRTPNVLLLRSGRATSRLPLIGTAQPLDPLDYDAALGLFAEEELQQMDEELAAFFRLEAAACQPCEPQVSRPLAPVLPPEIPVPPAGSIERRGSDVYRVSDNKKIGKFTCMLQWDPISFSMKCLHDNHVSCSLTSDCNDDAFELLVRWVAAGADFPDATSHRAAKPHKLRVD